MRAYSFELVDCLLATHSIDRLREKRCDGYGSVTIRCTGARADGNPCRGSTVAVSIMENSS